MQVERVPIDAVKPAERNVRTHDLKNRAVVRASLEEFGQWAPLVVRRSTAEVLVGNCRLKEMQGLGWTECDVQYVDVDDEAAARILLLDNRSSDLGGWETSKLLDELDELLAAGVDLSLIGWDEKDIEALRAELEPPDADAGSQDEADFMGAPIAVTAEQRAVIEAAAAKMRKDEDDPAISLGRVCELVCGDWLAQ